MDCIEDLAVLRTLGWDNLKGHDESNQKDVELPVSKLVPAHVRRPAPYVGLRSSGVTDIALWYELLGMLEVVGAVAGGVSVLTTLAIDVEINM